MSKVLAGVGGIVFSVFTFAAVVITNAPGGGYREAAATDFVATAHLPAVMFSVLLAMLGVLGLICMFAYLREALSATPANRVAASIFWGVGLVAAAAFAVGWGVAAAGPLGHTEGGSQVSITPSVTYLISQTGASIIVGIGVMVMGLALIVLVLASRETLPAWLRWFTLIAGVLALASYAYFPAPAVLVWGIVAGVWLIATRRELAVGVESQPSGRVPPAL